MPVTASFLAGKSFGSLGFVYDVIHDKTEQKSGADIKYGMLFDEHSGEDDTGH